MEDHNLSSQPNAARSSVPPVLPPALEKTADVLRSAATDHAPMEAAQKAALRSKILAAAQLQAQASNSVSTATAPADVKTAITPEVVVAPPVSSAPAPEVRPLHTGPSLWKRWFALTGAGFAVAALTLIIFVSARPSQKAGVSLSRIDSVNRLLISEAAASDAFTVYAEQGDARGVQDDSAFILKSRVPLTVDQVRQTIQIIPAVPTEIERLNDGEFRIRPQNDLMAGQVYKIAIPTLVAKEDGTKTARDFSWALQTKEEVRVLSSIPGDGTSVVPVDTGIEFTMNHQGWENATTSFEIVPAVPGRMEERGRRLVFIPAQPLQPGTRYEARLKKGLHLIGSELALDQDKIVRFETDVTKQAAPQGQIYPISEFQEVFPGSDIQVPFYRSSSASTTKADVQGFVLSEEQALSLMRARLSIPSWTQVEKNEFSAYQTVATNRSFQLTTELRRPHEQAPEILTLPKTLANGWYAVSVKIQGLKETWFFLQVTPVATYTIADKDRLMVWAVDSATNKTIANASVRLGNNQTTTDAQGLAQLTTPAFLVSQTPLEPGDASLFDLIVIGSGDQRAISVVGPAARPYDFGRQLTAFSNTWGYVYPDRPLYRPSDEAMIFGLAQDRDSHLAGSNLEVRLTRSGYWFDAWTGKSKVYAQVAVQPDAAGRFEGKIIWQNLSAGYYQVDLLRNGQLVSTRSIEVRDFVKPAYSLSITKNIERAYAGQEIKGTVSAKFFDGTPVPRAKLLLTLRQKYGQEKQQELNLDENGQTTFSYTAEPVECGQNMSDACRAMEILEMEVRPTVGEEGEIVGTAQVEVYGSELDIRAEPQTKDLDASVGIQTYRRQLVQDLNQTDVLGPTWSGRALRGQLVGYYFEKIQEGTYYDYLDKKVKPAIRYERRRDPAIAVEAMTDANGRATYNFRMNPARDYYELTLEGQDIQGRTSRTLVTIGHGWYEQGSSSGQTMDEAPQLTFKDHPDMHDFALGETIHLAYQHGQKPIEVTKTPGILFVTASRGIKEATVSSQANYDVVFADRFIPNVEIRAVTFWNKRFEQVQGTAFLKRETRELSVDAKPDQASYAPGSKVQVKIQVKDKSTGQPVSDVKVGFAVVDKALLALSYQNAEDPLTFIYDYVSDGVLFQQVSHDDNMNALMAGAEKGGGGLGDRGAGIRKLFKDTAASGVVTLNEQGEGTAEFTVPDNLTSWRVSLVALSADVRAGAGVVELPVTKPVFVEAVVPPRLDTDDKPVVKIRAFGSGLPAGTPVSFQLNAPTLGLNNFMASGTAELPVYVGIGKLAPGRHQIIVRVTALNKTDAIEKWVEVADTRFLKDEYVSLDVMPGTTLPSTQDAEFELLIAGKGRTALHPLTRSLMETSSARLDARLAANVARHILKDIYHDQDLGEDLDVRSYQDSEGGMRLLPYGGPDLSLSAQVAIAAPETIDQRLLADYLWSALSNASTTADEQIEALSGLAALGESVLPDLQMIATQPDLSLSQQLIVVRGLVAAGDKERAGMLLRQLLTRAERTDGLLVMPVGTVGSADRYEATAEAAALAAQLGYPEAEALERYVETHWQQDVLPVLAKARYLKARLSALPIEDGSISWTLDGSTEETLDLKQESSRFVTLTVDEAKRFRVTRVSGSVTIEFIRRISGRPASVPGLNVTRSYDSPHPLEELMEGDLVRVILTPSWESSAQDGCYQLRDHLPGGWQAVSQSGIAQSQGDYPYEVSNGEVSFVSCKTQDTPRPMIYMARVVSRGSYVAEAPLLQHMEYPSISALGKDQTVVVK